MKSSKFNIGDIVYCVEQTYSDKFEIEAFEVVGIATINNKDIEYTVREKGSNSMENYFEDGRPNLLSIGDGDDFWLTKEEAIDKFIAKLTEKYNKQIAYIEKMRKEL